MSLLCHCPPKPKGELNQLPAGQTIVLVNVETLRTNLEEAWPEHRPSAQWVLPRRLHSLLGFGRNISASLAVPPQCSWSRRLGSLCTWTIPWCLQPASPGCILKGHHLRQAAARPKKCWSWTNPRHANPSQVQEALKPEETVSTEYALHSPLKTGISFKQMLSDMASGTRSTPIF